MLDIKFIRENADLVKDAIRKKHLAFDLDTLIELDDKRKELLGHVEGMRAEQNEATDAIARASVGEGRDASIAKMRELKEKLQKKEEELAEIMKEWRRAMLQVPNIPDVSVPEGESDADNKEVRTWGDIPQFSFQAKGHVELMNDLGMVDFERGTKVAGFRGYFLKGDGMLLSMAIWQFVLNELTRKGFTPLLAPSLVRKEIFFGTGYLPQGEEDLYKTQDDTYLAGTAEVPSMGYFMDEVIPREELPKKFIAFSPCFRREAGSHGKDTKGLMRVHEFFKLEQVVVCEANHEESVKYHEEITANVEEIMQALGLPYRVVLNAGGDLGLGQVKKYDIESWVPSEGKYRETHSASYFHDFQTRRLNIRYKNDAGKTVFAHSLNNTAIATPRVLISLVENHQNEDGSVTIPKALVPYVGGRTSVSKK
ncbi:MAG TPA: serine--tRNA ligase [Candidatus Paceibacterota bacterium]